MNLSDLISPDHVFSSHKASCSKNLLQGLSEFVADSHALPAREVFQVLLERERLGSTAVGNGVAIPHGKLPGLEKTIGLFAYLEEPIDYDAPDKVPVDLVFVLLTSENHGADHLKALSRVARVLRDKEIVTQIRQAEDPDAIYKLLSQVPASNAA